MILLMNFGIKTLAQTDTFKQVSNLKISVCQVLVSGLGEYKCEHVL